MKGGQMFFGGDCEIRKSVIQMMSLSIEGPTLEGPAGKI